MTKKPKFWIAKKMPSTKSVLWAFVLLFIATETMIIIRPLHPSTIFNVALWVTFGIYELVVCILAYIKRPWA